MIEANAVTGGKIAVPGSLGCVHMSIVPAANGQSLLAFFRSRWADHIYRTQSDDGGLTWQTPLPTVLPNNNSSVQAIRLRDGRIAIVYNHSNASMSRLASSCACSSSLRSARMPP